MAHGRGAAVNPNRVILQQQILKTQKGSPRLGPQVAEQQIKEEFEESESSEDTAVCFEADSVSNEKGHPRWAPP